MPDLQTFYDANARTAGDLLAQVGHTVNGQPVDDAQVEAMTAQIVASLDLQADDVVLDLCCGNGIFSRRLAGRVAHVTGVDFSAGLLDVARSVPDGGTIDYHHLNALEIGQLQPSRPFSKVLMYAALQHFEPAGLAAILDQLQPMTTSGCVMMFGFVPDHGRKWAFYNTPKRVVQHLWRQVRGSDKLGHWWKRDEIRDACEKRGLSCRFEALPAGVDAARYRFNIIISR